MVDGLLYETEGVNVLDLRAGSKFLFTLQAHRDVGVTTERTFLHIAIAHAQVGHQGVDLLHVGHGLFCRAQIRL